VQFCLGLVNPSAVCRVDNEYKGLCA